MDRERWAAAVGGWGVPASAGRYTGIAALANPAVQTGPLHFVLKARLAIATGRRRRRAPIGTRP